MPILSIKSNILDFEVIDSLDPKTIAILDKSVYLESSPDKPLMEVLVPGSSKPIVVPFTVREYNVITSGQLNLSCGKNANLPDGVYCLTLRVCPHEHVFFTKTYLKTSLLDYEIDSILLFQLERRDIPSDFKIKYENAVQLIEAAKIHAYRGNVEEATEMYAKAKRIITKLNCK